MKEQRERTAQEHTDWPYGYRGSAGQGARPEGFENFIPLNTPLYRVSQLHIEPRLVKPEYVQVLEELLSAINDLRSKIKSLSDRFEAYVPSKIVPVHGLASKRYYLRRPFLALVETYENEIIARLPEFDIYASGEIEAEALASLQREIIELYEDLRATQPDLGALPASWLRELSSYIEERA